MLEDPLMHTATAEIIAGERPRYDIQRDIKAKVRTLTPFAARLDSP